MTHTPGPWRQTSHLVYAGEDGHEKVIASVEKRQPQRDQDANRHLIAAAPDLLEALEELVVQARSVSPKFLDSAREAIAKAKGSPLDAH